MIQSIFCNIVLTASLLAEGAPSAINIDTDIGYNPKTAAVLQCKVKKVLSVEWPHGDGTSSGICLLAERDSELYTVIVAPSWHIGSYMQFASGDILSISGSLRMSGKGKILVARWIKKDGRTLHLRTMAGIPHWESNGPVPKKSSRRGKGSGRGSGGKGGGGRPSGR